MDCIDTHHHIMPRVYLDTLEKIGVLEKLRAARVGGLDWSEQQMFQTMDNLGIDASVISLSSPGVYFGNDPLAIQLARQCNVACAELCTKHPNRVGALSTLPLPSVQAALEELRYSFDELGLDGVILLSNYGEKYLGHPDFNELFAELNRRKAIVLIHATMPAGLVNHPLPLQLPPHIMEFTFDIARTVVDMMYSGYPQKYPDIKFIISNCGGGLPFIAPRLTIFAEEISAYTEKVPNGTMDCLRKFYYDTTFGAVNFSENNHSDSALKCLLDFVPNDQVMFGSDIPLISTSSTEKQMQALESYLENKKELSRKIWVENAKKLYSRWC